MYTRSQNLDELWAGESEFCINESLLQISWKTLGIDAFKHLILALFEASGQ